MGGWGCGTGRPVSADGRPPDGPAASALYPATRCGECHVEVREDWLGSAHARAASSPLFVAQKAQAGGEACGRCHTPLAEADATRQLEREGVGCVGCHLVNEVELTTHSGTYRANLADNVMYASICDAKNHYFHKMGCSPLHEEARFCGACHLFRRQLPSGETLPVYTEYEEWAAGPAAAQGIGCQECHMPAETISVAEGERARTGVGHHGFLGLTHDLRKRALKLAATVTGSERVQVDVSITNVGAGHRVPTGSPERRLVLRARTLDDGGREVDRAEKRFGRRLVDGDGKAAPFWRAVRVVADDRLAPGQTHREVFELAGTSGGEVHIEAFWRVAEPEVLGALGLPPAHDVLMGEVRLPVRGARP